MNEFLAFNLKEKNSKLQKYIKDDDQNFIILWKGVIEMTKNDKKEIENLLNYLQDKIEECYKHETEIAIKEFLEKHK